MVTRHTAICHQNLVTERRPSETSQLSGNLEHLESVRPASSTCTCAERCQAAQGQSHALPWLSAEPALRDAARRSTLDALVGQTVLAAAVLAWPCGVRRASMPLAAKAAAAAAIEPAAAANAAQLLRAVIRSGTLDALGAFELLRAARLCVSRCAGFEGGIDGSSFDLPSSLPASSSSWRSFCTVPISSLSLPSRPGCHNVERGMCLAIGCAGHAVVSCLLPREGKSRRGSAQSWMGG